MDSMQINFEDQGVRNGEQCEFLLSVDGRIILCYTSESNIAALLFDGSIVSAKAVGNNGFPLYRSHVYSRY